MTLASGISKRYKDLFLIDDDGLRRIEGVLTKAATAYPESLKVMYHIEREDDRFFETHDISDVLADPNVRDHRIKLVGIELRRTSSLEQDAPKEGDRIAVVIFDKDEPPLQEPDVRVRISSPNRTWTLMLADELEPQITRLFKIKRFPTQIFLLFAPIIGMITYRSSTYLGNQLPSTVWHGIGGAVVFIIALLAASAYKAISGNKSWLIRYFASEPVFLRGDEITAYNERDAMRKNIFWVILVGFFVSLVAGIATLLFN